MSVCIVALVVWHAYRVFLRRVIVSSVACLVLLCFFLYYRVAQKMYTHFDMKNITL